LPPDSPDLNPIEKLFAKLKALLRKAAARTMDALWQEIGQLLDASSAPECSNYVASSGYVIEQIENCLDANLLYLQYIFDASMKW